MVGKLATSKAGHDIGTIYVIVQVEGTDVYLCDGKYKPLDNPKKKNMKHLQIIKKVPIEIQEVMMQNGKFYNEGIKRAIKLFSKCNNN